MADIEDVLDDDDDDEDDDGKDQLSSDILRQGCCNLGVSLSQMPLVPPMTMTMKTMMMRETTWTGSS